MRSTILSMTSVYDAWIGKITNSVNRCGIRPGGRRDPARKRAGRGSPPDELFYIKDRLNKSSSILTDKKKNSLLFRPSQPKKW